jgi:hypothetical protein
LKALISEIPAPVCRTSNQGRGEGKSPSTFHSLPNSRHQFFAMGSHFVSRQRYRGQMWPVYGPPAGWAARVARRPHITDGAAAHGGISGFEQPECRLDFFS